MTIKRPFVFDSHALLTLFQKEAGHDKIVRLIRDINRAKNVKYLNAINLGEIISITTREFGQHKKLEVLANIERMKFTILPATNDLIFHAAEYKAQFSISYADCFVLASAVEQNAVIVTGDPEFKKTLHLAEVFWIT